MNSFERDMMTTDEKLDELHSQLARVESLLLEVLVNTVSKPAPQQDWSTIMDVDFTVDGSEGLVLAGTSFDLTVSESVASDWNY